MTNTQFTATIVSRTAYDTKDNDSVADYTFTSTPVDDIITAPTKELLCGRLARYFNVDVDSFMDVFTDDTYTVEENRQLVDYVINTDAWQLRTTVIYLNYKEKEVIIMTNTDYSETQLATDYELDETLNSLGYGLDLSGYGNQY